MTTTNCIDELETRLAHQDQAILELSDEVYRQQRQIAELERRLAALSERVQTLGSQSPAPRPEDEVPPHY